MKNFILTCLLLVVITATGCTAATTRFTTSITNDSANIVCYSGGKEVLNTQTEGKPISEQDTDGYLFKDSATGKLVEVSADCVINYK